jgi:glycosyltransferase involved in cell wall biosynthesis
MMERLAELACRPRVEHQPWSLFTALNPFRSVHLINPLSDATGGSELRTVMLFDELRKSGSVRLWTEYQADPVLKRKYPIERIIGRRLKFPKTGTFVIVGVYACPRRWIHLTRPRRVIVVYNTPNPERLRGLLRVWGRQLARPVEVVYASEALKRSVGYPGTVQPSPIDLDQFTPAEHRCAREADADFIVGRLSRDILEKHHPLDAAFYRRLAGGGIRVRIMGGTSMAPAFPPGWKDVGRIELLPVAAVEPHRFLQGLDCFFYRTAEHWTEPFGRVVMEAMACGLPVVCRNRGGYVEVIENGRNGFLFETEAEAFEIIQRLRQDRALGRAVGYAARETVDRLYSSARRREIVDYYLR